MKRLIFIFSISLFLFSFFGATVFAEGAPDKTEILPSKEFLLQPTPGEKKVDLPSGDFKHDFVPRIINVILGIAGTIAFVTFTVAGVMLVTAHDNEEQVTKAKNVMLYGLLGLVVMAVAYAVVYGILTLQFT